MASRVLLHLGDATSRCIFSNVQLPRVQLQSQGVLRQSRNFKRDRNIESTIKQPLEVQVQVGATGAGQKLWKATVFATAFTGASFLGATVWEYERIRSQTFKGLNRVPFQRHFRTATGWRQEAKAWWNGLSEGQRTFYFICYANVAVFLAWKIPQLRSTMMKYFTCSPATGITCLPMILSTFSHYNLWHLAANMYVLHSFSTPAVSYLGREHFVALYLSSGVASSLFSIAYKIMRNQSGPSLGASGAIMGILAFICTQYPDTRLNIILLPQFTFSAGAAIKSLMAMDTAGCVFGWRFFDHAAHLGGAFFGIFWQQWGIENIWRKRAPVLTQWHEFRHGTKSS
ncbi:presenilins-associated rhomboid-like protein, mitochondrial [Copidosoma floridanum]|uniref:presenilins-associated rhomboid-like protein, mitochondrial n=1 Tax=Copidosoma floridanum TaxID=29053 RepID=UPI0006C9D3AC|nr:presenilins-associated rhomboid-like protein, mitochondrial [Copidosoma floridanum]